MNHIPLHLLRYGYLTRRSNLHRDANALALFPGMSKNAIDWQHRHRADNGAHALGVFSEPSPGVPGLVHVGLWSMWHLLRQTGELVSFLAATERQQAAVARRLGMLEEPAMSCHGLCGRLAAIGDGK